MFNSIVIYAVLAFWFVLFAFTLKRRDKVLTNFTPSKEMTNLIKGFACLVIAFHHFSLRESNLNEVNLPIEAIAKLGGTFALVIFFFLSGYGITLSEFKRSNTTLSFLEKRVLRVYKPLLFVCILSFFLYYLFNLDTIPENIVLTYRLPESIAIIGEGNNWVYNLLYVFGFVNMDWYVVATIVFYLLFFISFHYTPKFTSMRKVNFVITVLLLFIIYYTLTYFFIGVEQGHYYRNTWAFVLGILFATFSETLLKHKMAIFLLLLGFFIFCYFVEDIVYVIGALISVCFLGFMFYIDKYFYTNSRILLYLGGLSYFVYLSHIRIVYNTMWFLNKERSILLFLGTFLIISVVLNYSYEAIQKINKKNNV